MPSESPIENPQAEAPPLAMAWETVRHLLDGVTLGHMKGHSPDVHEALYAVAHGWYVQAKYKDAAELFSFLRIHNHMEPRFVNGYAACLQMQQEYDRAAKQYGVASLLDLTDPDPVIHMAECLLALSRHDEAREALDFAQGQTRDEARFATQAARVQAMLELMDAAAPPRKTRSDKAAPPPSLHSSKEQP